MSTVFFARNMRRALLVGILLAPVAPVLAQQACQATPAQQAAIDSARVKLDAAPESLDARIALSDRLLDGSCYDQAVQVLEAGRARHGRSRELAESLRKAASFAQEHRLLNLPQKNTAQNEANFRRDKIRCTRLGDAAACDQALQFSPNDIAVTVAKGDALLKAGRPVEAQTLFTRAAQLIRRSDNLDGETGAIDIDGRLTAAKAQVAIVRQRCFGSQGTAAVDACKSILPATSPEAAEINERIATLAPQSGSGPQLASTTSAKVEPPRARPASPPATVARAAAQPQPRTFSNIETPGRSN
jgi:hypothetical protein